MEHVLAKDLLPAEQRALRKGSRGCLDALVIDQALAREAENAKRSLSVCWIDYRKAYDLVPHEWILQTLKVVKAPQLVRRVIEGVMPNWKTDIEV